MSSPDNPYGNQPPPYGNPPPPPAGGYGYGGYPGPPADHPKATTILVLGILSLVCCGLFTGIPAIVMGKSALTEIDASHGRIGGRGTVKAGWICGIIGTALSVVGFLFYGLVAVVGLASGSTVSY